MRHPVLLGATLLCFGCGNDFGVSKQALCDGVLQGNEDFVDSPFDADEDGAFDGNNTDCQAAYAAANLDCDDADPEIRPGAAEVECDGIDNDCDESSADAADLDGDGADACIDCDDADPDKLTGIGVDDDGDGYDLCDDCDDTRLTVNPGAEENACNDLDDDCNPDSPDEADLDADGETSCTDCDDENPYALHGADEICDNEIDDDCDDQIDESCATDYSGDWELDTRVRYDCAFGYVDLDFDLLEIADDNPDVRVYGDGTNAQPGNMDGTFVTDDSIEAENVVSGSCDEIYAVSGTFTTENTFVGTFTATFVGGGACADCRNQSWDVVGTRL